jgi:hypothetical protein
MEMINPTRESSKAQMMTVLVLVMFLLMVSALFAFSLLNISANSASQSLSVSLSSMNYGTLLKQSANLFAKESASRALIVLANYEYNASLRKGNFIPSFGFYASNLMVSGILPNDTSGYPQNAMGNLTFARYNSSILSGVNFAAQNIIVNETTPVFFQTDPYHIRVSYMEDVALNVTGATYRYSIPVNASIALNNTPDLFYAQQGVLRTVKFASLGSLASQVGSVYATSGNSVGFVYGTIYNIPSSATSSAACASVPSTFSSAPYSGNIIIATYNAYSLSSCISGYAGLITYILPSSGYTAMPYLVYSSSSGVLSSLPSGMKVLLYGPGMDTLNVEGLRNAVMNGQYFASPFTPSYIDRAGANFLNQSPNGIFTFSNYNTQTGNFNGASSFVDVPYSSVIEGMTGNVAVSAWVRTTSSSSQVIFSAWDGTNGYQLYSISGNVVIWSNGGGSLVSPKLINDGNWHYIVGVYTGSTNYLYVDGALVASGSGTLTASTKDAQIGTQCSGSGGTTCSQFFSTSIANVQLYSTQLTAAQVQREYQQGISSLPISGNSLVGWWPLNGNAQDYSGNGYNGVATSMSYALPPNYARDSILVAQTPSPPQPIPGILSCTSNGRCSSNSLPNLYLSYMPLEVQSGSAQTGGFSLSTSEVVTSSTALVTGNQITIAFWADQLGSGSGPTRAIAAGQGATYIDMCYNSQAFFYVYSTTGYYVYGGPCTAQGVWKQYVGVYNGLDGVLYVNGVAGTPVAASGNLQSAYATVIGDYYGLGYSFNGLLSNVQFYNAALSPAQVNSLYQEGIFGMPFTSNLVGWWPLNGNAQDYSGNGHNGTATAVVYPYFPGTYNSPGLSSSIASTANEWQALGLANT